MTTTGHDATRRPRLTPAMADCRRAVGDALSHHLGDTTPGHLTVAVSGGADSLALAWATAFVAPPLGFTLDAVTVDHGLQENSAEVAENTRATLTQMGIPTTIIRVSVDGSGNVEEHARTARYDALTHHAQKTGAVAILLGHTLDDQAETVLLGLTRGSGPTSIRGMSVRRELWLRPFLGITRQTTSACVVDAGFSFWLDPHNTDRRFVRPRIRGDLLPVMEDILGPGIPEALANTAALIADDDDYLTAEATDRLTSCVTPDGHLEIESLAAIPSPVRRRVLRLWAREATGASMTLPQTQMVDALVVSWKGQGPVDVPGGKLSRRDGFLVAHPAPTTPED